MPYDFQGSAVS